MKLLHRPDLYGWSIFDESRNIDFNSVLWVRPAENGLCSNVAIDPLPVTSHDWAHLQSLGGVATIILTNSDHVRDAVALREKTRAKIFGPAAERSIFPIPCDGWLTSGDRPIEGLVVQALPGSKTPGELALVVEDTTLVTGDLIRSHGGGRLDLLPAQKLTNPRAAFEAVRGLLRFEQLQAVLPGDGWPVFRFGRQVLEELVARVERDLH